MPTLSTTNKLGVQLWEEDQEKEYTQKTKSIEKIYLVEEALDYNGKLKL